MGQVATEEPRQLGDFLLESPIKAGAVGRTYKARALRGRLEGQVVCLKVLAERHQAAGRRNSDRLQAIESLMHEAKVVGGWEHPNIVRLLDQGVVEDIWFLVLEYVPGANLEEVLELRNRPFPPEQVRRIALQALKGLQFAHERNVLHRDIKPANILVCRTTKKVKLADFGIAKADATLARPSTEVGTRGYAAPEQLQGRPITASADIYGLGVTMWELATHLIPWDQGDTLDFDTVELPAAFVQVLKRCTDRDPSARYQSAAELAAALRGMSFTAPTTDIGFMAGRSDDMRQELEALVSPEGSDPLPDDGDTKIAGYRRDTQLVDTASFADELSLDVDEDIEGYDDVLDDLARLATEAEAARTRDRIPGHLTPGSTPDAAPPDGHFGSDGTGSARANENAIGAPGASGHLGTQPSSDQSPMIGGADEGPSFDLQGADEDAFAESALQGAELDEPLADWPDDRDVETASGPGQVAGPMFEEGALAQPRDPGEPAASLEDVANAHAGPALAEVDLATERPTTDDRGKSHSDPAPVRARWPWVAATVGAAVLIAGWIGYQPMPPEKGSAATQEPLSVNAAAPRAAAPEAWKSPASEPASASPPPEPPATPEPAEASAARKSTPRDAKRRPAPSSSPRLPRRVDGAAIPHMVATQPPAADIFVDGAPAGTSPARLSLSPGRHEIEARVGDKRVARTIVVGDDTPSTYLDLR